ncbi:MAG: ABC transporter ATP-binding protein [Hyphomonadaceae bacterium]
MAANSLIQCENLTKIYNPGPNEIRALDDVSFEIEDGEFIAIVGSSGSGKSTLMNMLGGLDKPTSGTVRIGGAALSNMNGKQLAKFRNETIGFVFQQFQLLPKKSALHNVILPLHYRRPKEANMETRAQDSLTRVGLGDRMDHKPTELSGGQQQRVAIARALVGVPKLLLADEPTGALDSVTSEDVMSLLHELNDGGLTVILITHDHEVAAAARRTVTFKDGKIQSDENRHASKKTVVVTPSAEKGV